jgi:rubrerythrin
VTILTQSIRSLQKKLGEIEVARVAALDERDRFREQGREAEREIKDLTIRAQLAEKERDLAEEERVSIAKELQSEKEMHARCQNELEDALAIIQRKEGKGWECPRCGAINAPITPRCFCPTNYMQWPPPPPQIPPPTWEIASP